MAFDIATPQRPTGASEAALDLYEATLRGHQCFAGDPIRNLRKAVADSPDFVMARVFTGYLYASGTDAAALPSALAAHAAVVDLPANDREAGHVAALGKMARGELAEAAKSLSEVSAKYPRDALALQIGQLLDFLRGDSRGLRDRIGAALPHWDETMPGYHAVLGMHAFGLEETGHYAAAEATGRRAIDLEPRNGWAQHAVAHVMEMQDRREEGVAWMRGAIPNWTGDSYFQVHNWWHLALFHLGLGQTDEVLALYDGPLWGERSTLAYDMVDASALLWRLRVMGVDVGDRWQALADAWEPAVAESTYAFNDAHAAMAFVGAGRSDALAALRAAQRRAAERPGDNAAFLAVAEPVVRGLAAYGEGDWRGTVEALQPVRATAHRFGGSHAQRDVIDLTLLEAARRAGDAGMAAAIEADRAAIRLRVID
ncbi:MAG: tetratricopeptide repeat protein [Caulobacterales bacterium]|nr:tetratricopeptide repeat protein [Caulobacterales bacterium]